MVTYEYVCDVCGMRFQVRQHLGDAPPATCPNGHTQIHRVFSPPTIVFKGSGFYVNDSKRSTNKS
jgi:putative FmdB family regulatory protein